MEKRKNGFIEKAEEPSVDMSIDEWAVL